MVAFVKSSEWLIYSVDVQEAGEYTATFRASSPWNEREVWVWVDGVLKAQVPVPDTGSFDTYEDATANSPCRPGAITSGSSSSGTARTSTTSPSSGPAART